MVFNILCRCYAGGIYFIHNNDHNWMILVKLLDDEIIHIEPILKAKYISYILNQ